MVEGNRGSCSIDGEQTFESKFAGIARAQRHLLAQFYIVRDDAVGTRLKNALLEKARAGVAVHLL